MREKKKIPSGLTSYWKRRFILLRVGKLQVTSLNSLGYNVIIKLFFFFKDQTKPCLNQLHVQIPSRSLLLWYVCAGCSPDYCKNETHQGLGGELILSREGRWPIDCTQIPSLQAKQLCQRHSSLGLAEGQWESMCLTCFVARRKGRVALSWMRRQRWHSYIFVGSLCMNNLTCQNMMESGSGTKEKEAGTVRR